MTEDDRRHAAPIHAGDDRAGSTADQLLAQIRGCAHRVLLARGDDDAQTLARLLNRLDLILSAGGAPPADWLELARAAAALIDVDAIDVPRATGECSACGQRAPLMSPARADRHDTPGGQTCVNGWGMVVKYGTIRDGVIDSQG